MRNIGLAEFRSDSTLAATFRRFATGTASEASARLLSELKSQLGGAQPALTMIFASTKQPLEAVLPVIEEELGGITLGASTSGEFTEKGDSSGSVAAFVVAGEFRVFAGIGRNLKADLQRAVGPRSRNYPRRSKAFPTAPRSFLSIRSRATAKKLR